MDGIISNVLSQNCATRIRRTFVAHTLLIAIFGIASALHAQNAPAQETALSPLIENTGEATVRVPPNYVDFWLQGNDTADTVLEAMQRALEREPRLNDALREVKLRPKSVIFFAPAVTNLSERRVKTAAQLRFNLRNFQTADVLALEYAQLCDTIIAISETLGFTLAGPFLGADNESELIQSAVRQATENAYAAAAAVATSMSSKPVSIDTARVVSVNLGQAPDSLSEEPNLGAIACTAQVSVRYATGENDQ